MTGNTEGTPPTANVDANATVPAAAGQPNGDGAGAVTPPAAGSDGQPADHAQGDATQAAEAGAEGEAGTTGEPEANAEEAQGAPESYEAFKVPEGMTLEAEATSAFQEAAKADNLSQAQAQRYVDLAAGLVDRTMRGFQEQARQRMEQWAEQAKADPVVGGPGYEQNVKMALAAVSQYGDAELKQAFEEYGLGNHPAFVRAFYRIGKAMSETGAVHGLGSEAPPAAVGREQSLAQRIAAEQSRGK